MTRTSRKSNVIEEVKFGFSKPQHDFLHAAEKNVALVSGFGAGKTRVALSRLLQNMMQSPGIDQAYLAPTYPLIRDIFYPAMDKFLPAMDLDYTINKSEHIVDISGLGKIYCRTMDNPEKIVGWEVADAVLDEFDILPIDKALEVFRKTSARLRQDNPAGRINQLYVTTTPEGFKATYKLFDERSDEKLLNSRLIQMSTYSNAKNLPADYIEELKSQYPAQLIEAYLMGKFVNLTSGVVYSDYDRERNRSTETMREGEDLFIGQDFNVGKMASTIYVKRDNGWHAVAQLSDLLDTPALIETLHSRYNGHKIIMYPDASGKNRKSANASESDIALLKLAGFKIKANKKNPFVKDRVLAVNKGFRERYIWVNDAMCPDVATDLEQQVYDKNGEPDKKSGNDHQNDASGYPVAFEFPIKKPIIVNTGIRSAN